MKTNSKFKAVNFDCYPTQASPPRPAQHFMGTPRPHPPVPAPPKVETEVRPLDENSPKAPAIGPVPQGLFDGRQVASVRGQHHHPRRAAHLGPAIFHCCLCGLLLVESTYNRWLWRQPVRGGLRKIETREQLSQVLATDCWAQRQAQASEVQPDESQRRLA